MHFSSMKRVNRVFSLSGLCATEIKVQGVKYSCCGKVSVVMNGLTTTGYILDEVRNKWCVHLTTGKRIMVNKVPFVLLRYEYPKCGARNKWCVTHYWPLRIKICAGCVMNMQF